MKEIRLLGTGYSSCVNAEKIIVNSMKETSTKATLVKGTYYSGNNGDDIMRSG